MRAAGQDAWEARAGLEVGHLITRYLEENPPPERSDFVSRLVWFADGLQWVGNTHKEAEARWRIARTRASLQEEELVVDEIVAEAYAHVAEGFRLALLVPDLPEVEHHDLVDCLFASLKIARKPPFEEARG